MATDDIEPADDGQPSRDYGLYAQPGFFADAALAERVTTTRPLLGEAERENQLVLPRELRASDYDLGNGSYRLFIVAAGGAVRWRF